MTAITEDITPLLRPVVHLPLLTFRLLSRFWPQLMALWLIGAIGGGVLNELAVTIGQVNGLAGLSFLSFVVLLKLVIIVALLETVRPGLPALHAASAQAETKTGTLGGSGPGFITALALTLVPFFAYYAAWGFLGETVRNYSKLSLDLTFSGQSLNPLEFRNAGAWLFASVAVAWAVRRFAKWMHKRSKASVWPILIVVCEANWAFIGLYVISDWQDEIRAFVAHLPDMLGRFFGGIALVKDAAAANLLPPPADALSLSPRQTMISLFFYALYPAVWLTLAALVYGYDINGDRPVTEGRIGRALSRWQALPKALRDFIAHFLSGTAKRYRALAEGVGLALNSGIGLTVAMILLYRLLDWGSMWLWYYLAQQIGPHEWVLWQTIAQAISLFLGNPSDPGDSLLVTPIKICLLAAALEIGFSQGRKWHGLSR
ncbi:hypothetical protein [Neorhizobium alkalisoli]|jgi:hypothetical protein|uniref:Uncharacterized protein n=1 Tax=Neorhizobium alkalisoli TaxID=528178 RepID=A0A561QBA1_9HYPH|nr:hypothetical protein [Neorhizobium alkalisoli]TWF47649.1 hypothetical protein FHW37_111152 [Neorhizobium alkalisoli]